MTADVIAFPSCYTAPAQPASSPARTGGIIAGLFGAFRPPAPPVAHDGDEILDRARLVQAHLRAVRELIEHLGPADAVSICRIGLDAAEASLREGGSK